MESTRMTWLDIEGQDDVIDQFRRRARGGRLGASFLFVGPEGIGKRAFAIRLAQSLLCPTGREELSACGSCPSCQQIESRTHSDFRLVDRPADRTMIPIEAFIGDREHRMREGLCPWIARKPTAGSRRVAVIDDADDISAEAANSLLKTLEEPPPKSVLILIGTSAARQLPTIRSRCQLVRFHSLSAESVAKVLAREGMAPTMVADVVRLSEGSLTRARTLADPAVLEFRGEWFEHLGAGGEIPAERTRIAQGFVDGGGKELASRRARMEVALDLSLFFYRQGLRHAAGLPVEFDPRGDKALQGFLHQWNWGLEGLAACIDRSLQAQRHIDQNANVSTCLEAWLDDLARIERSGPRAVASLA